MCETKNLIIWRFSPGVRGFGVWSGGFVGNQRGRESGLNKGRIWSEGLFSDLSVCVFFWNPLLNPWRILCTNVFYAKIEQSQQSCYLQVKNQTHPNIRSCRATCEKAIFPKYTCSSLKKELFIVYVAWIHLNMFKTKSSWSTCSQICWCHTVNSILQSFCLLKMTSGNIRKLSLWWLSKSR